MSNQFNQKNASPNQSDEQARNAPSRDNQSSERNAKDEKSWDKNQDNKNTDKGYGQGSGSQQR